jgi:hypothetical protein
MARESCAAVLTTDQAELLTIVLNRLIPGEGPMPAAGALGIAAFIDGALAAAPHLREQITSVLTALPSVEELRAMSPEVIDDRLRQVERAQPHGFDLLLQATYTGYYRHPSVLEALGGVESDAEGELQLDRFPPAVLDRLRWS